MRRSALSVVVLAGACFHAPRVGQRGSPVVPAGRQVPSLSVSTSRAKLAFDAAARTGDLSRVAASFADNALFITPTGDSIQGRTAIALYLAQLTPEAVSAHFVFAREGALKRCVGGALEHLAFTVYVENSSHRSDTLPGVVSVLWQRDSTGNARVIWASPLEPGARSRWVRSLCHAVRDSVARAWRYSVSMVPVSLASAESRGDFESALRARGWDAGTCACYGPTRPTPRSEWPWLVPPSLVAFQYRPNRGFLAELLGGRLPQGSTLGARDSTNRDHTEIRLAHSGIFLEALVSHEVAGIHLGIGPVVQRAHWVLTDSLRPSAGLPSFTRLSRWTLSIGVVADVKYQTLLDERTLFVVRAQTRRLGKARTPGMASFPSVMVGQGSSSFGVGFGVVF